MKQIDYPGKKISARRKAMKRSMYTMMIVDMAILICLMVVQFVAPMPLATLAMIVVFVMGTVFYAILRVSE